ncbi:MAG: membrane protein insertase YidC [Bryobacterales bacterium]|nr:membrane protein insertase YidC [Bryobacterales bacterium]
MADEITPQPPKKPGSKPGEEISVERRMLLALVLMGAVLIGSQYLFKAFSPPEAAKETATESAAPAPGESGTAPAAREEQPAPAAASSAPTPSGPAANAPAQPSTVKAEAEEHFTIETAQSKVTFSNKGAVVERWILKEFKSGDGHPLELVNEAAFSKTGKPFALDFRGQKPPVSPNTALYTAKLGEDGKSIDFEYAEAGWTFRKHFSFPEEGFVATVSSEVLNGAVPVPHLLEWRGGFGDPSVDKRHDFQRAAYYDRSRGKLETKVAKDAKEGTISFAGTYSYAGIEDKYFAAMFLPEAGGANASQSMDVNVYSDLTAYNGDSEEHDYVGVAVGGSGENDFRLFVGPKNRHILKSLNPQLADLVDFGWFFFIAEPLFVALNWLTSNYLHNYGWSIIVLTIAINFVTLPLKLTSMKSMKKMQALQPQIQAINDRYKGVSMRDPRAQQKNQEMMALYQKNGVNPAAGCVPMILQIPFFFAFYQMLSVAIELRGASWLWVPDLSRPETFAIRFLPLAMVVSQIFMQRLTPTPSTDPTQKMMMTTMPLVFGVIFWWASSGLVLYWLTSNLIGIVQQVFINKFTANGAVVAVVADSKPKRRK